MALSLKTNVLFSDKELSSTVYPSGKFMSCFSCGLYKDARSPRMEAYGKFDAGILNIGEAPGEIEDERGKPWQGKSGRLLKRMYARIGINLFDDCLNINAVNCRPKDNRTPKDKEIACCRSRVMQTIQKHKPKVIVALGESAVISLIGHRWKKDLGGISKWRGWAIPDRDLNAWICPAWHPSFVLRRDSNEVYNIWEKDLARAVYMTNVPFPKFDNETKYVEIIDDLSVLEKLNGNVAIDYETTGLKPHAKEHKIVCGSVATTERAYVFMIPESKKAMLPFIKLLKSNKVGKIAHNMKFEHMWTKEKLGITINNWQWDTMLAAHILDNRPGITGLKFQVYVNFGVVDYDSEIEPWLKGREPKNANSMNRVLDLIKTVEGRSKLLTYCGLDSLYTARLAEEQQKWFK